MKRSDIWEGLKTSDIWLGCYPGTSLVRYFGHVQVGGEPRVDTEHAGNIAFLVWLAAGSHQGEVGLDFPAETVETVFAHPYINTS